MKNKILIKAVLLIILTMVFLSAKADSKTIIEVDILGMLEQINDPIEVEAYFSPGKVRPLRLIWRHREYLIKQVNLAYTKRDGRTKFYYFAVSDEVNYFKLEFNSENLDWRLVEIYAE